MRTHKIIPSFNFILLAALCAASVLLGLTGVVRSQSFDREGAIQILKTAKSDLLKNYYDPTYKGMDVEERFNTAAARLKQATSNGQAFGIIAQALLDLDDSHTFFIPPQRASRTDYGWQMQMVGDRCFVVAVKPGSDAQAKGLKTGDELLEIDGFAPARENLWKMRYYFYGLRPRPGLRLHVKSPDGQERELDVMAKIYQGRQVTDLLMGVNAINDLIREEEDEQRLRRQRYYELGSDALIWKMPVFDQSKGDVDDSMDKARKHKALILDLRGNSGGYEETLLRLMGNLFDHDVKVGEIRRRSETKLLVAKTVGERAYKGQLVVLIDSDSSSAAELLARVVQLERRGTVTGDHSAGKVMRSRVYQHQLGVDIVSLYAVSVTDADLVMTDGHSLEHTGVTPDELLLPTPSDLAAQRDPVLSRAASIVGITLDPQKAGSLFPIEWRN